jgi:hypothetical protein
MWRARFGRGFGPVVRQTAKWMNGWIILLFTQWPWGWVRQTLTEISNRNISWGRGAKGGRWVQLTILPPKCTDCLKIWNSWNPQGWWNCFTTV